MIRNNKRALYEKIMRNVSREVKRVLNENDDMKVVPFDKLDISDFAKKGRKPRIGDKCFCKVNFAELIKSFKYFRHACEDWIGDIDGYLKWLEGSDENIQDMCITYHYSLIY